MEKLFTRLCEKYGAGIPYLEAVQLVLWVYCTLDVLPSEFRQVSMSRDDLTAVFSRLASVGKVVLEPVGALRHPPLDIGTPEHWDDLIARLLRKEIDLDDSFPDRIH